jgi:DNA-binding MarR family transcriptional regulator
MASSAAGGSMLIEEMHELPGHLIRRAHQISGALFAANLSGYDLTSVQYAAMVAVACNPAIDATRLSELIAFDRATLGGVLDRLEAKGLLIRSASRQDRRIKTVTLTSAGEALLAEVEAKVLKAQADMLEPLDPEERRRFIALLKKFVAYSPS